MFVPSNNLLKLGIGAAHQQRVDLANRLFFPVAVDILNPTEPMRGGSIGNRGGGPTFLTGAASAGVGGNSAGYIAEFSTIEGDPLIILKKMTSDGEQFVVVDGRGKEVMLEDPTLNGPYSSIPRYRIKADGTIYDLLEIRGADNAAGTLFQHWEFAAAGVGPYGGGGYNPPAPFNNNLLIDETHYVKAVGRISFRPKAGASSQLIQDNLSRASGALDSMSRFLRTLHDEAKGPFANIILR